ncbi:unnamed protein product [Rotaria magnacalcarata]|uniref:Death ligand signal enhancer n=4 Tax=Rotaria magnacalcarata TaxID=392030 RepID=A0A815TZ68_9BILA|nr:unnamed protein product [Rotaria magnacalcarata]CAF2074625.1 unnamed protein product [Rotaria magnacalcarata]CAF4147595.1 unnamed protein product [Rotaria magnacalcarata]
MWRLANYFYRAFRNTVTHRYSQDIVVSTAAIHKDDDDDDDSIRTVKQETLIKYKHDFDCIAKTTRYSFENFEKLQKSLYKNSLQQLILKLNAIKSIQLSKVECTAKQAQPSSTSSNHKEETLNSPLQTDQDCLKSLAELNEETISIVNNELAMEAFEEGNVSLGIENLQMSAKDGKNSAALYNLGICHEQGIGVEKDLMKACDYYRQAASLGHANAFINLTLLSNHIDADEEEKDNDENIEQPITNQSYGFRFSFTKQYNEEQSQLWNDYALDLSKTIACLL